MRSSRKASTNTKKEQESIEELKNDDDDGDDNDVDHGDENNVPKDKDKKAPKREIILTIPASDPQPTPEDLAAQLGIRTPAASPIVTLPRRNTNDGRHQNNEDGFVDVEGDEDDSGGSSGGVGRRRQRRRQRRRRL